MNKFVLPSALALLVTLIAFSPMAYASQSTPFKGNFSGTFAVDSSGAVAFSGTGIFNHLGLSTFSATAPPSGPLPFTVTAADSDQLFLSLTLTGTTFTSPTTAVFSLTYTISGGSGHLADATGSGTMSVNAVGADPTFSSGTLAGTLAGTITE